MTNMKLNKLFLYSPLILAAPLFLFLSINNFISHSELWAISSGRLFGSASHEALIVYIRPFFYSILKVPFYFDLTNHEHIYFARIIFGILGFLISLLSWLLVKKITKNSWIASGYVFILLSFHVYTYNIFRVRSDILCQTLVLATILLILNRVEKGISKFSWSIPILSLLISLTTPKSIYAIIWLCIFYFLMVRKSKPTLTTIKECLFFFLAPSYILLLSVFTIELYLDRMDSIFAITLNYYLESFSYNWKWEALNAIVRSLKINFFNYILIFSGLGFGLYYKKKKSLHSGDNLIFILFTLAFATLCIHPERWDYFIASLMPYLALPSIFILRQIRSFKIAAPVFLLIFLIPLHMTFYRPWWQSNEYQIDKIKELEKILIENPTAMYFDSTGILPRENSLLWFMGPGDEGSNKNTVRQLNREKPEIIFQTAKLRHGGPDLMIFLHTHYEQKVTGIWISKKFLPHFNATSLEGISTPIENVFIYDHHIKVR